MQLKILFLFYLAISCVTSSGQECNYKNLSNKLDFTTSIRRFTRDDDVMDSCIIDVTIKDKMSRKLVQTIKVKSEYMFSSDFNSCTNARSYVTGTNAKRQVVDNDYGDLIIADFNFDGIEDFAVKRDSGGNGGPYYDFYLQNKKGKFVKSLYLSKEVEFFPSKIDKRKLSLTIYAHAGACGLGEDIYKYNVSTQNWKHVSHRIINVCK